jgi:hypothetical protein
MRDWRPSIVTEFDRFRSSIVATLGRSPCPGSRRSDGQSHADAFRLVVTHIRRGGGDVVANLGAVRDWIRGKPILLRLDQQGWPAIAWILADDCFDHNHPLLAIAYFMLATKDFIHGDAERELLRLRGDFDLLWPAILGLSALLAIYLRGGLREVRGSILCASALGVLVVQCLWIIYFFWGTE